MVEALEGSGEAAAAADGPDEGPRCGVDAARSRAPDGRDELGAPLEHQLDLIFDNWNVVRVFDFIGGGADHDQAPLRQNDVPVAGLGEAVDGAVNQARMVGHHDPRRGADGDGGFRHRGDLPGPGAGGVDHHIAVQFAALVGGPVPESDAGHVALTVAQQVLHLVVQPEARAVRGGCGGEGEGEAERLEGPVRHAEGEQQLGVQIGLQAQRLLRRQLLDGDAGGFRPLDEFLAIGQVVFVERDEQPLVAFDDLRDDLPQDHVLFDALPRGLLVFDAVASAAVKQAVGAAGGPVGDRTPIDHGDVETPQGQIVRGGHAGEAGADDDGVGFGHGQPSVSGRVRMRAGIAPRAACRGVRCACASGAG